MNNKQSETEYVDIARYIKAREDSMREILSFHIDPHLAKKECEAVIDGTINYLWRNGFGEHEIDILVRDMMNMITVKEMRKWSS